MKCEVCGRRMRSGEKCFECDGCGNTCPFRPVSEVLEELEGELLGDSEELPSVDFMDGLLRSDEEPPVVRHTPKKISKKKAVLSASKGGLIPRSKSKGKK